MAEETLLKSLMASGLGSRRQLANAIRNGHVRVNGEVVENFSHPINPENDVILMDGKTVQSKPEPKIISKKSA